MTTGRKRLTWVTALTVASLLLGGGAMNALAEERGGGHGNHGDRGNAEHAQPHGQAFTHDSDQHEGDVERDNDNEDLVTAAARVTDDKRPGLGCGDADDHSGAPGNPGKTCDKSKDNENNGNNANNDNDGNNGAGASSMENDDQTSASNVNGDDSSD